MSIKAAASPFSSPEPSSVGLHHRENGPAIITYDGTKMWYINGKLHREDGPAYENYNSYNAWWINGERHREDGPAIELSNGTERWYINGIELSPKEIEEQKQKIALAKQITSDKNNPIGGLWDKL